MTKRIHFRLHQLIIPAIALTVMLAVICWKFPANVQIWRSIGIITAWTGSGLLMVNLLLMIREPHIARLLGGLESMYHWHHRLGVIAYILLLCHPLALAMNGWVESPHHAWQMLAPWQQPWPVWLGWAALLLMMFGLVTTFALRLPYRLWRSFHFTLGLSSIFSLAHISAIIGASQLLLLMLLVTVFALSWRFLASDLGAIAYPYRVNRVSHLAQDIIEVRLTPCATALAMSPGQFILLAFKDGQHYHGCGEFHPFTVSGIEQNGDIRVAIKALGPCTQRIQKLEPGVIAHVQGPFGIFLSKTPSCPQLWVAGGIGITPFMAALRSHPLTQTTALIYLFNSTKDAAFLDELLLSAKTDPNLKLIPLASDGGIPNFNELLSEVSHITACEVHICGPKPMLDALLPLLHKLGVSRDSIHYDSFDFR